MALVEQNLDLSNRPLTEKAKALIATGRSRFDSVKEFYFVPSDYDLVWQVLDDLPRGKFCEWGSGFGIVTGLAEILGFEACGIEFNPELADASRQLLADFELSARIETGDYLEIDRQADYYFVNCWPGKTNEMESRFESMAPQGAKLLTCHGQSDIRCKIRDPLSARVPAS